MKPPWSSRIGWKDLPAHVQGGIEQILGSPVVEAIGQQGGFSPGTADRVLTQSGRRAFINAVGYLLNEDSPFIHRKEAAITGALPESVPAPSLIGTFDDGEWVALVLQDIPGRHPHLPWTPSDLKIVLDALLKLSRTPVWLGCGHLPSLENELAEPFLGWERLRAHPPADNNEWILENLDELERLASRGVKELIGASLVHADIRSDNVLITPDDRAVLVDWPWGCMGAPWIDALTVLINVRLFEPTFDANSVVESHPVFAAATPEGINAVLSGFGAYFIDAGRLPLVPGLPGLREFQADQGKAVMDWLRHRLVHHKGLGNVDPGT